VHDADVGAVLRGDGCRHRGVVLVPGLRLHVDGDVVVLGVELVHQLRHERAVGAGEAVPEVQLHLWSLVGVPRGAADAPAPAWAPTGRCRRRTRRRARPRPEPPPPVPRGARPPDDVPMGCAS
jgi:hypothetical protein